MKDTFGFIFVTTDPTHVDGGKRSAYELVLFRLDKGIWPIYSNTRNRKKLLVGRSVAFYVGGSRNNSGLIVATAVIKSVESWSISRGEVDPECYLSELADQVVLLESITILKSPISLKK